MDQSTEQMLQAQELLRQGQIGAAADRYRQILAREPEHAEAMFELANCALKIGAAKEAIPLYEILRDWLPESAEVLNNLGAAKLTCGDRAAAEEIWKHAVSVRPDYANAWSNLGDLARDDGRPDAAAKLYGAALERNPHDAETAHSLGLILFDRGQWRGAEECLLLCLKLGFAGTNFELELDLLNRIALCRLRQDRLEEAASLFQNLLLRKPELPEVYANLAFTYERMGRIDDAIQAAQTAIQMRPGFASAYNNLAVALRSAHRLDEALHVLECAAKLNPDGDLIRFNHGTISLLAGRYQEGWPGYEYRERSGPIETRDFAAPAWRGEALVGKRILLHCDQGFGDTLQFVRFLPRLTQFEPAEVILEAPLPLLTLLNGLSGYDRIIAMGDPLPEFDLHCAVASLPGILRIEEKDLPGANNYLRPSAPRLSSWKSRLEELSVASAGRTDRSESETPTSPMSAGITAAAETSPDVAPAAELLIGVVWQGNAQQSQDIVRSCPIAEIAKLTAVPGIRWFSLQKGPLGEAQWQQNETARECMIPLGQELTDFEDTAAVLSQLDLLITVDTSVAHLAGALGTRVWTLLCHTPDWRWKLTGNQCPWYPSMRLFRQPEWGDWSSVIEEVSAALRDLTQKRSRNGSTSPGTDRHAA